MFRTAAVLFVMTFSLAAALAPRAAQAEEHIVQIISDLDSMRFAFEPRIVIIQPGDTVTWVNQELMDHNVVTYPDGFPAGAQGFESPFLSAVGERWSHTFEQQGTYEYHCIPHLLMGMHASVIVDRPSQAGEFHKPSPTEVASYRDKLLEYFDGEDAHYKPHDERASAEPDSSGHSN